MALGFALVAQLLYLAVRFRWTYGLAAVGAMFHDVAILVGVFAWLGKQFDGVFPAALLTVIGYSVNDSVVDFERIREQRRARTREPLEVVANDACLQTVPRRGDADRLRPGAAGRDRGRHVVVGLHGHTTGGHRRRVAPAESGAGR